MGASPLSAEVVEKVVAALSSLINLPHQPPTAVLALESCYHGEVTPGVTETRKALCRTAA